MGSQGLRIWGVMEGLGPLSWGTRPPYPLGFWKAWLWRPMAFGKRGRIVVRMGCLEKRSPALRGRNRARDIQADGAPMAAPAPGRHFTRGPALFSVIGRRSQALKNPSANSHLPR